MSLDCPAWACACALTTLLSPRSVSRDAAAMLPSIESASARRRERSTARVSAASWAERQWARAQRRTDAELLLLHNAREVAHDVADLHHVLVDPVDTLFALEDDGVAQLDARVELLLLAPPNEAVRLGAVVVCGGGALVRDGALRARLCVALQPREARHALLKVLHKACHLRLAHRTLCARQALVAVVHRELAETGRDVACETLHCRTCKTTELMRDGREEVAR